MVGVSAGVAVGIFVGATYDLSDFSTTRPSLNPPRNMTKIRTVPKTLADRRVNFIPKV